MARARADALKPMQRRFFEFLVQKTLGDRVTDLDIQAATGWKPDTFATYLRKNKFDPFLAQISPGLFRIVREGAQITQRDVAAVFTQVSVGVLVLTKGQRAVGDKQEYHLDQEMGQGAVAHVWKAKAADSSDVAIKIMNPRPDLLEPTHLENVKARFRREARNGIAIHHPRIVQHLDRGELKGHPFLVMALARRSLSKTIKTSGPLNDKAALAVVAACLDGLSVLHAAGCVHRDIKPANVLEFAHGYVLGDLGIVRWSDMNPAFTSAATLTRASVQLGSWYYMAPEQRAAPHDATPLSDIYSLGVTWYETLTGRTPDPAEVGARAFTPASSHAGVNDCIARMLSYAPNQRPSVSDLTNQIAALKSQF